MRRVRVVLGVLVLVLGLAVTPAQAHPRHGPLGPITHLVVIYEENHSFDNLYGTWGKVNGQRVDGLPSPARRRCRPPRTATRTGACAERREPHLAAAVPGVRAGLRHQAPASHFGNRPFLIDDYTRLVGSARHRGSPPNGVLNGTGLPVAAPATWCTGSTGAVPDRCRPAGPVRHR